MLKEIEGPIEKTNDNKKTRDKWQQKAREQMVTKIEGPIEGTNGNRKRREKRRQNKNMFNKSVFVFRSRRPKRERTETRAVRAQQASEKRAKR
jgi:hypothetical protein